MVLAGVWGCSASCCVFRAILDGPWALYAYLIPSEGTKN
jgi:hypothetical protein